MKIKDGGPVFPIEGLAECGMSLRDYFAAAALQGIAASGTLNFGQGYEQFIANMSFKMADAMLAEREKVRQ